MSASKLFYSNLTVLTAKYCCFTLWTNGLILSRCGQKCLLNTPNVNVNVIQYVSKFANAIFAIQYGFLQRLLFYFQMLFDLHMLRRAPATL